MRSFFFLSADEYDRLNPPDRVAMLMEDGLYFREIEGDYWLPVGYIPCPRTRLGWFIYHVVHGLAMHYRLFPVLVYAFREAFGGDNGQ